MIIFKMLQDFSFAIHQLDFEFTWCGHFKFEVNVFFLIKLCLSLI